MTPEGREQAIGTALLAGWEADLLGLPAEALADVAQLERDVVTFDLNRQQYLVVRSRLLGPDTYGYEPSDLARAAADLRLALGFLTTTVTRLADRLAADDDTRSTP